MKLGEHIESTFGGKEIKLKWRTQARVDELIELGRTLKENTASDNEGKNLKALAQYYRDAADVMFIFEDGLPEPDWFSSEEFPQGQFDFLRKVFINPQDSM